MKCSRLVGGVLAAVLLTAAAVGNVVAYYPFEGNVNDSSGRGHHGSIVGGADLLCAGPGQPRPSDFLLRLQLCDGALPLAVRFYRRFFRVRLGTHGPVDWGVADGGD